MSRSVQRLFRWRLSDRNAVLRVDREGQWATAMTSDTQLATGAHYGYLSDRSAVRRVELEGHGATAMTSDVRA